MTGAAVFLPARLRPATPGVARDGGAGRVAAAAIERAGHDSLALLFERYRNIDPDWADLGLVCPAESSGLHRIARLRSSDFKVYRSHGRKRLAQQLLG